MKLKLIAALSLSVLLGCATVPPLSTQESHAPSGYATQGKVTATVVEASITPNTKTATRTYLGDCLLYLVPIARISELPEGLYPMYLARDPDQPTRYIQTEKNAPNATHVAEVVWQQASLKEVAATLTSTMSGASPLVHYVDANRSLVQLFPGKEESLLHLTLPAESPVFFYRRGDSYSDYTITKSLETWGYPDSRGQEAAITFTVKDENGTPIPGLTREYFRLSISELYNGRAYEEIEADYLFFEEVSKGTYRLTALVALSHSGTYRYQVDVVNPAIDVEANFYRH